MRAPIIFFFLAYTYAIDFPHNFKRCYRQQPDFKQCLKEAAQHNVQQMVHPFKDLHLPGLKPFQIPSLTIDSGKHAVAVVQHFTNCNLYGMDNVEFDKFEFDFERKVIFVDVKFAQVTKKCNYQLKGRVLLLPIQGEGESTIVLRNMRINGFLQYIEFKRSGKTHLSLGSHELGLDVGHVYFHFDNLFNGDKGLGDSLNKVMNDNWKQVFDDVKDNYAHVLNTVIRSLINDFWGRMSVEEAFDQ